MKTIKLAILALSISILSGCATIAGGGSSQEINVQAVDAKDHKPIQGVVCDVTDGKDVTYPVIGNPGKVEVTRGHGALTVSCHKHGYKQGKVAAGDSFNAWMLADVIFWPGAIVDAVDGAAEKYPSHISVLMVKTK